ncbi:DUF4347 domain-containing protein [Candidatus Micrarchaeota archaeon]|nr:DUF4347 domain-containing protein [Candidatus Micrarchaeota archaeon]
MKGKSKSTFGAAGKIVAAGVVAAAIITAPAIFEKCNPLTEPSVKPRMEEPEKKAPMESSGKISEDKKTDISKLFSNRSENLKTDEELLEMVPEKHRPILGQQLKAFADKGATQEQQESYARIAQWVISNDNYIHPLILFNVNSLVVRSGGIPALNSMRFIAEETNDKKMIFQLIYAFNALVKNPNFKPEMLNEEFVRNFVSVTDSINKKTKLSEKTEIYRFADTPGILACLFGNPNSKPEMLTQEFAEKISETINTAVRRTGGGKQGNSMLYLIETAFGNPNFKPAMLDEDFADKMSAITNMMSVSGGEWAGTRLETLYSHPDFWTTDLIDFIHASAVVDQLGIKEEPEIILNFVYATKVIGDEKTLELHKKCGIMYFMRYTKAMLEKAYASLDSAYEKDAHNSVIIYNKNDWNKAFYNDWKALDVFKKSPRLFIYEVDSDKEFFATIEDISDNYGRINAIVIGGHGNPNSIELGASSGDRGNIDMSDKHELEVLRDSFVETPQVVIVGCSTGKKANGIAAMISDAWDAELWAPTMPSDVITEDEGKKVIMDLLTLEPVDKTVIDVDANGKMHMNALYEVVKFKDGILQKDK